MMPANNNICQFLY